MDNIGLFPAASVLAIGAHADDVEIGCGGILARASACGARTGLLCLTTSDYVGIHGDERSKDTVLREQKASSEVLNLDFADVAGSETLSLAWDHNTVAGIENTIKRFKPTLILTHWHGDTHQDHQHAAWATLSAARREACILAYEPISPSGRGPMPFNPQVYFDIGDHMDRKIESLKAHKSQYDKYGDGLVEALISRARWHGHNAGCQFAEAFEVVRMTL